MKKLTVVALCISSWTLSLAPIALAQGPNFDGPRDGGPRFGEGRRGPRPGGFRGRGEKGGLNRLWRGMGRLQESGPALSKTQAKRVVSLVLPWSKKPQMTQTEAKNLREKLEATLTSAQKEKLGQGPGGWGGWGGRGGRGGDGPPRGEGGRGEGRRGEGGRGPGRGGDRPEGRGPREGGDGGRGPGGRGGEGRGFGGRGMGGMEMSDAQRQSVRAWMETSNPFYAPTGTASWKNLPAPFQKDVARRYGESRAVLESLSRLSR